MADGKTPMRDPETGSRRDYNRKRRKRVGIIFGIIRRGKTRAETANDSSRCTHDKQKSSRTRTHSKFNDTILRVSRSGSTNGNAAAPATEEKSFSPNSSVRTDTGSPLTTATTPTMRDTMINMAPPQDTLATEKEDEYRSAAAFLTAFHSRTVAVVGATELVAIDEDSDCDDMSVDENEQQRGDGFQCTRENFRDPIVSRCTRNDGSLKRRRNKTSCCLLSLAADDAPDLTEEVHRVQHDFAREDYSRNHPTEAQMAQGSSHDADAWGLFLDSEADGEREAAFASPSSVQHYGMVGGMRASASPHHSRNNSAQSHRFIFDRQMTV